MLSDRPIRGFTLIEVLVAVTIAGVLMVLGAPALGTYLQNAKVLSATEALHASVQRARLEAIRRNAAAQFIMTNSSVAASAAASAVPSATGQSWVVLAPNVNGSTDFIDGRSAQEGGAPAGAAAVLVTGSASGAAFTGSVSFNGLGGTSDGNTYLFDVTNPTGGSCVPTGPIRCRRVVVSPGGQIHACDPAVVASDATDTRRC